MASINPKELEKRLESSYNAGFFDGYHEGVDDTHIIWVEQLSDIKGIGPYLRTKILLHMEEAMKKRLKQKGLEKNELSKEVKELEPKGQK